MLSDEQLRYARKQLAFMYCRIYRFGCGADGHHTYGVEFKVTFREGHLIFIDHEWSKVTERVSWTRAFLATHKCVREVRFVPFQEKDVENEKERKNVETESRKQGGNIVGEILSAVRSMHWLESVCFYAIALPKVHIAKLPEVKKLQVCYLGSAKMVNTLQACWWGLVRARHCVS